MVSYEYSCYYRRLGFAFSITKLTSVALKTMILMTEKEKHFEKFDPGLIYFAVFSFMYFLLFCSSTLFCNSNNI